MSASLSVVLCTFNGAPYLPELLNSLVRQQRKPDELLICDDGSTDSTHQIIAEFEQQAPFIVRSFRNTQRLGVAANFVTTAGHARGEWIAFCDQDDIWYPEKLLRSFVAIEQHVNTAAIFCNARLVDADGRSLKRSLWQQVSFSKREQKILTQGEPWEVLVRHPVVSGAGLIINSRVRNLLSPIPDNWLHDAWAVLLASATGPVVALETPLFDYRQHAWNVIGAAPMRLSSLWRTFRTLDRVAYLKIERQRWRSLASRLESIPDSLPHRATTNLVAKKLDHLFYREHLPTSYGERWWKIAGEVHKGGYRRFTKGWTPLLADLFL